VRRALAACAAVAALCAAAVTQAPFAAPTPATPQLTPSEVAPYPERSYRLSLPRSAQIDPASVQVVENGQPVNNLRVDLPGQTGSANVGVVLLIDASLSMKGDPIEQAMAASRAFAGNRASQEQLGTILFNSKARTVLPLTTSDGQIASALAKTPQLGFGTHISDAVEAAVRLLDAGDVDIGSIVLLSDGRDVGSTVTEAAALDAARKARVRVFSVGLRSPAFTPGTLQKLADGTGGTFTVASSAADLESIYSDLSVAISNEYLISYRSLSGPAQKVFVSVTVPGFTGAAVSSYTSPGLPLDATTSRTWWDRFIQSTAAELIVVLLAVLLVGLAVFLFLRRRDRRFERRLARFVTLTPEEQAAIRKSDVSEALEEKPKRPVLQPSTWYSTFAEDVELSRIDIGPRQIAGLTVAGSIAVGIVFAVVVSSGWGLLLGLVVPFVVRWLVSFKLRRLRQEFAEQLPDNLDVIASALRAGHSLLGALAVTVEASSEPSKSELGRAVADEQLGVPLDDALRVVAKRMDNRDLIQVAVVSMLQREAGTNAAEVLERVSENVRAQMDLKRLVRTLTAQGRMARWIVSFLPLFLFGALFSINRDYLRPLWDTNGGIAAMVVAAIMVVGGSLIIKKIVEIEV
jgi:tight adherence protein B